MVILALETTSDICSVALGEPRSYIEDSRDIPRRHNEQLLQIIDTVCQQGPHRKTDIDCVAFSAGPGSFTGVRMGAAVTQAIATALGCKAYSVPTALALAHLRFESKGVDQKFAVVRRSRRDLVYRAEVVRKESNLVLQNERLVQESEFSQDESTICDSTLNLSATSILSLAAASKDQWHAPHLALPMYVEGDTPWVKVT